MFKLNRKFESMPTRNGISIIEVLTSMAIATIGVFGIMVMIPFAVKQSQSGLDSDASNALGRNAIEEIQIQGLLDVNAAGDFSRLLINARADGAAAGPRFIQSVDTTDFVNDRAPGLFHFDPIGFAVPDPDGAGPLTDLKSFTIDDPVAGIETIEIMSTTASRGVTVAGGLLATDQLTVREANRFCRSDDDVVYQEEVEGLELAPPQPFLDFNGADPVKRQSLGRISWSAFFSPVKSPSVGSAPTNRFQAHVLVYRDRFVDPTDPVNSSYGFYLTDMSLSGFTPTVSQITLDTSVPLNFIPADTIFRGDWVMLVNRIPEAFPGTVLNTGLRAADEGYRIQVMFAKVNRVTPTGVTVDGGAFDFLSPGSVIPPGSTNPGASQTYMIHLRNVVNVFERSVSIEK